jgi:hypothetical protein
MVRREKPADDTQSLEELHPPISFYEAHLEHIQSICLFEALLKHPWSIIKAHLEHSCIIYPFMKHIWSTF